MKRRHHEDPPPAPAAPSKLAGLRPHQHDDDDERPTREDRAAGHSRFEIPVPVPKLLRGKHRQRD
jgi:hypothetical protein